MTKRLGFKGIKANKYEITLQQDDSDSSDFNISKKNLKKDNHCISDKSHIYDDLGNIEEEDPSTEIPIVNVDDLKIFKEKASPYKINFNVFFQVVLWIIALVFLIVLKQENKTNARKYDEYQKILNYELEQDKIYREYKRKLKYPPISSLESYDKNKKVGDILGYNYDYKKIKKLELSEEDMRNNRMIIRVNQKKDYNSKEKVIEFKKIEQQKTE